MLNRIYNKVFNGAFNKIFKNSPKKIFGSSLVVVLFGCMAQSAMAVPFGMFDSRSMAMGGVGVATGARYAAFNNPALLTTSDEIHEWFLLAPTVSQQIGDPDKVEDELLAFQQAATVLDVTNNPANQAAVQSHLNALDGSLYQRSGNVAGILAIPSRILSGAAFFNVYEASTARPEVGCDVLAAPTYAACNLAQRGLRVAENGIAAAKTLEANKGWMRNLAVGLSTKFLLVEAYGYAEPLRSAEVNVDRAGRKIGSQFAFDVGVLKEVGVWKFALVAKNIVPGNYKYGSSGDEFKIEPQVRAGFAYQSRHSILELDIDVLENDPVGFALPSQMLAIGWEWQTWRWLALRAGYQQNLSGDEAAYGSLGLGMIFSDTVHLDIAGMAGEEGEGLSAQLGVQF